MGKLSIWMYETNSKINKNTSFIENGVFLLLFYYKHDKIHIMKTKYTLKLNNFKKLCNMKGDYNMTEGREVVLKTDLQIKEEAKRKAKIAGIVIDVFFTIILIIPIFISKSTIKKDLLLVVIMFLICWSVIIVMITLITKHVLPLTFEKAEYAKRSIAYVNANLSVGTFVKVKKNKQDDFIQKLQKRAEFYAIINERNNLIEIWIRFNFEEEKCKYEDVSKEYFYDYYSIQE